MATLLRQGSTGDEVKQLQTLLTNSGYDTGGVDSIFGKNTAAALKSYQAANGLTADAVAGDLTWAKLNSGQTAAPAATAATTTAVTPAVSTPTQTTATTAAPIIASVPALTPNTYGISATPEEFSWDASKDAAYQKHMTSGNASIMQDMSNRGILNSTTTTTQLAQLLGQATPEYEQLAYDKWNANQSLALQRASFLSGLDQQTYENTTNAQQTALSNSSALYSQLASLDDESYATYKTQLAATQAQRTSNIQAVTAYYNEKSAEVEKAINALYSTGFADNDTALTLGISVGTTVAQAATAIAAKQKEVQTLQTQLSYLISTDQQQSAIENQATQLRNAYYNPREVLTTATSSGSTGTGTGNGGTVTSVSEAVYTAISSALSSTGDTTLADTLTAYASANAGKLADADIISYINKVVADYKAKKKAYAKDSATISAYTAAQTAVSTAAGKKARDVSTLNMYNTAASAAAKGK